MFSITKKHLLSVVMGRVIVVLSLLPLSLNAQEATPPPEAPTEMPTDIPPATPTYTETPTLTPTPTLTETPTPTSTETPTHTPTATPIVIEATGEVAPVAEVTAEVTLAPLPELTSEPTATATATTPPVPLLYHETFDTIDPFPEWLASIYYLVEPGANGNRLHITPAVQILPMNYDQLGDLTLQVQLTLNAGEAHFGLRYSTAGLYLVVVSAGGQVTLYRDLTPLASANLSSFVPGQPHILTINVIGADISVVWDGAPVLTYTDLQPLPAGTLFIARNFEGHTDFYLDDLYLYATIGAVSRPQPRFAKPLAQELISNGEIVFEHTQGLYSVNPDGSGVNQLITLNANNHPTWSPNGLKIAYTRHPGSNPIWLMNADGSSAQPIPHTTPVESTPCYAYEITDLAWSPDGTQLAYTCRSWTYVINVSSGAIQRQFQYNAQHLSWSPDGSKLAVSSTMNGGASNIFTLNMNSTGEPPYTQLTTSGGAVRPEWSPNGQWIVYNFSIGGLRAIAATGGSVYTLTTGQDVEPSWSPDGTQLVFRRGGLTSQQPNGDLYLVSINQTTLALGSPSNLSAQMADIPSTTNFDLYSEKLPDWQTIALPPCGAALASGDASIACFQPTPTPTPSPSPTPTVICTVQVQPNYTVYAHPDPDVALQMRNYIIADNNGILTDPQAQNASATELDTYLEYYSALAAGTQASVTGYYINQQLKVARVVINNVQLWMYSGYGLGLVQGANCDATPGSIVAGAPPAVPTNPPLPTDINGMIAELATYGVVVFADGIPNNWIQLTEFTESNHNPSIGQNYAQAWTVDELREVVIGVRRTAQAFNLLRYNDNSGTNQQAKDLFGEIMSSFYVLRVANGFTYNPNFVEGTQERIDSCYDTSGQACTANGFVSIAFYGAFPTGIPITEYTVVHEFGHRFDNQGAQNSQDSLSKRFGTTAENLTTGVRFSNPLSDCEGVRLMGEQINPAPVIVDWERSDRGWGSGPGTQGTTSFQQNPRNDVGVSTDGEISEASADMFLNWIYRRTSDVPPLQDYTPNTYNYRQNFFGCPSYPVGAIPQPTHWTGMGFLNKNWVFPLPQQDDATLPGDRRYWEMERVMIEIFRNQMWS